MGPAKQIRISRTGLRLSEEDLAAALGVTAHVIRSLEDDDTEFETALSIPQTLELAQLLSADILDLLGEVNKPGPLPVAQLRAALTAEFSRAPDSREMLEDEIDWDLGPLLEGLRGWDSVYTIAFVKRLATAIGCDWRAVLQGVAADHRRVA